MPKVFNLIELDLVIFKITAFKIKFKKERKKERILDTLHNFKVAHPVSASVGLSVRPLSPLPDSS